MAISAIQALVSQISNPGSNTGVRTDTATVQKNASLSAKSDLQISQSQAANSTFQAGVELILSQSSLSLYKNNSSSEKSDATYQKDPSTSGQTSEETGTETLTSEEEKEVDELISRDREVRAHEQAHIVAGGNLITSSANFNYQTGPDGKRYAIGGEVGIDTSPVKDNPQATISKAQHIKRTALAPAEPSTQDYQVAAKATTMASEAAIELARKKYEESVGGGNAQDTVPISTADITA